ncbi:MAG: hypothetical protein WBY44_17920 [Bryobacteraceae bacterium]|jgi:hypothetical protein
MNALQDLTKSEPEDRIELSKQGYFTILLDENFRNLESALEDDGFKVVVPPQGLKDDPDKDQRYRAERYRRLSAAVNSAHARATSG